MLVHEWIVFAYDHFVFETVPLGVEEVAGARGAHHLHQDGPDGRQTPGRITVAAERPRRACT